MVTKLAISPVRADLVVRLRLVNQLQLGMQHPLTLIAAPVGFGKTTLFSSWLESVSDLISNTVQGLEKAIQR